MDKTEFARIRDSLGKTQGQMAELLHTSLKAIQSYEQGWRVIPAHAERQMLLLLSMKARTRDQKPCWVLRKCSAERKRNCPAWEFKAGKLCWFINGTLCEGTSRRDWKDKMKVCRPCKVLESMLGADNPFKLRRGK